jgi:hypothetical protein
MARLFIVAGTLLIVAGLVMIAAERMGIRLGRLPGDIRIEGKNGSFYFPIVTCLLISVVVSLLGWLFGKR